MNAKNQKKNRGMKLHLQTLALMQQGTISKRAAILLGHLDYYLSPYETRRMTFGAAESPYGFIVDGEPVYGHEHVRHGVTAPDHIAFWEVSLCNMLGCRDVRTLRATIRQLRKATIDGKRFCKAKRAEQNGHPYWVFKSRGI